MAATSASCADGRRVLDAVAHVMEPPGWLEPALGPRLIAQSVPGSSPRPMGRKPRL